MIKWLHKRLQYMGQEMLHYKYMAFIKYINEYIKQYIKQTIPPFFLAAFNARL